MIKNKMSPDGFVQVCLQLAYYTMCVELVWATDKHITLKGEP